MNTITAVWHSNAPWGHTGYAGQTAQVVRRLVRDGHNIAVAANYGLEATVTEWEGAAVYPRGYDMWNNDIVGPYFDDWTAQHPDGKGMQFTLFDVWVYSSPRFDDIPTVSWVPIDHMPAPTAVVEFLRKPTVTPLAMSQFGERMMREAGLECRYAPHAIETSIFKPTESVPISGRVMTGRELMGIDPDKFVVGCVNANKAGGGVHRKAWAENLLAFSVWAQDHPDAVLYLHTDRDGAMGGWKMPDLIAAVGLKPHQVKIVNQYAYRMGIPPEGLAACYSGMDVLLSPTYGEGFGIPVIEAQGCGVPVIVANFSAQPELVGDGWIVNGQPFWDAAQKAWFQIPFVSEIIDALEAAYQRGRGRSDKAVQFVAENYDADVVFDRHWRPLLQDLAG